MCSRPLPELLRALRSHFFLVVICSPGKLRFSGLLVAQILFWRKFANSVKSGCVSPELKAAGAIPGRASAGIHLPGYGKTGIRKSKTGRWRAAALILLNLFMIAHIIQWRLMGRTISPIEPSETMHTLQKGFVNAGFIFFSLAILATLIFGRFVCGWGCHILALQDLCGWLLKKMGLHPKPFRSRLLVYVPLDRRAVYVCLAHSLSIVFEPGARTNHPEIHESFGDHKFLADVSFCRGGHPVSVYLRLRHGLFFGAKRLLHLCLPIWRFFRSRRQIFAGKNPRYACVQSVRALHCHVHFERVGACGSEAVRDGGRSGLHEMHGLRQRVSKRRALFRLWEADAPGSEIECH